MSVGRVIGGESSWYTEELRWRSSARASVTKCGEYSRSYARCASSVCALTSGIGDGMLMQAPDFPVIVANAKSG
ncbi:hypothetical protein C8Q74DRAFT_1306453 [Fomes fomentarius]|nr:hypothetical protein C8Q74DRAFT_1306453 [Fomes fomentarius]